MTKIYKDCERFGHDWAIQDNETFMIKICLRCGQEIFFFPEEVDYGPDMDANGSKINKQA